MCLPKTFQIPVAYSHIAYNSLHIPTACCEQPLLTSPLALQFTASACACTLLSSPSLALPCLALVACRLGLQSGPAVISWPARCNTQGSMAVLQAMMKRMQQIRKVGNGRTAVQL